MTIMGIDQSLTCFGVVEIDTIGAPIFASPVTIPKSVKAGDRIYYLYGRLLEYLQKRKPLTICREGYLTGSGATKSFTAGELGGMIKVAAGEAGYTWGTRAFALHPGVWRKIVTGSGKAPMTSAEKSKDPRRYCTLMREAMAEWATDLVHPNSLPKWDLTTDLWDAYGIALACQMISGLMNDSWLLEWLKPHHLEAVMDDKKLKRYKGGSGVRLRDVPQLPVAEQKKLLKTFV